MNSKLLSLLQDDWRPYLRNCRTVVQLPFNPAAYLAVRLWRHCRLSTKAWHLIARRWHPIARRLIRQKCHLWLYPGQDEWSYMAPVPALASIHDLMHRYERRFPEVSAFLKFYRREQHYKNMCRWSAGILADSATGKEQINESYGTPAHKVYELPYIAPAYMLTAATHRQSPGRLQLPENYIFYPAQFWAHKNHLNLIEAVAILRDAIPDLNLVLVGAPKNGYKQLKQRINSLNLNHCIHFLGYVPNRDVPELYRRARAMIMPSFFGPTNIPPLEAFAAGCPAAVSNIYGMPEQVGKAALLFDPHSVREIALTIYKLWTDPSLRADLSRWGMQRFKQWNQAHFNQRLADIIRDVLRSLSTTHSAAV